MEKPNANITSPDPLIDEIRAIRAEIAEQFGNDVDRLCDHLQEREREHPERILQTPAVKTGRRD